MASLRMPLGYDRLEKPCILISSTKQSECLMKRVRSAICTCLLLACWCDGRASAATASYTVTFDATWSQATHSNAYPPGAHFSLLIGGVHNDQVSFWSPGGLASAGIEQMAEVGGTTALQAEIQAAINAGTGSTVIQGSGILSPGSTSVSFEVSDAFPLVTLVTMVAPSPDWFVGVHNFDLCAELIGPITQSSTCSPTTPAPRRG